MARTKIEDLMVLTLGRRRSELAAQIAEFSPDVLTKLQAEFTETEAALKEIDPTIETLAEEAARLEAEEQARIAAEEARLAEEAQARLDSEREAEARAAEAIAAAEVEGEKP